MKPTFIVFICLFIALYLGVHYYLLTRGCQALSNRPVLKVCFIIVFLTCALSLLLGFTLENKLPISWAYFTNIVGSSWFIALLYILLFTFFFDIVRVVDNKIHFLDNSIAENYNLTKNLVFFGITTLVVLICTGGYIHFKNPSVVNYPIALNKSISTENSKKILIASDLHLGYTIRKKHVQRFVDFINEQKPDIVLLCGDIIDRSFRPVEHQELHQELSRIQAPLGVYGVLGNHEYISQHIDKVDDFYKKSNIRLLRDETMLIDSSFYIIGRDDHSNHNRKTLNTLTKDLDETKAWLVLDHQPNAIQESIDSKIDIQVSGHTHNGQVWPINKLVKKLFRVHYGHKQFEESHIIVTSGLGLWGGLFRIGTQSEVVVVEL